MFETTNQTLFTNFSNFRWLSTHHLHLQQLHLRASACRDRGGWLPGRWSEWLRAGSPDTDRRDMARMEISPVTTSCHEWLVWWFSMLIHHIPSFTYVFTCFYHWSLGPPIIFLVIVGPSLSSHEGFQCIPAMLDYQSCSASGSGFEFDTWIPGDPRRHGYTQKTMDMMKDAPSFDRSIRWINVFTKLFLFANC